MTVHIYIDESSSLTDPYSAIFTLAAIRTEAPQALRWIVKRVKRRVRWQRSKAGGPPEFKFHNTTDLARATVLSALAREKVGLYAFSVFKGDQCIPHTPENYGLALCGLLAMCLGQGETVELVVDMPFNTAQERSALTTFIQRQLGTSLVPHYVDSQTNHCIQLADFVAGAVRAYHTDRSPIFYHFIHAGMVGDQMTLWKDLKREWHRKK